MFPLIFKNPSLKRELSCDLAGVFVFDCIFFILSGYATTHFISKGFDFGTDRAIPFDIIWFS